MSREWHDINEPSVLLRREVAKADKTSSNSAYSYGFSEGNNYKGKRSASAEYRILWVKAVEPAQGFERNKPFDIEGEVELLVDKLSRPRVLLYPIGRYKGQDDYFVAGGIEAFIDRSTLRFRGTCKYLFDPEPYACDSSKSSEATWDLVIRVEGSGAEKAVESAPERFPRVLKFQPLRKGDYDEHGARRYGKVHSGEHFKANGVVKELQSNLIKLGFLRRGGDDGFFGSGTEGALKLFQRYAMKSDRMRRKVGKLEKAEKCLNKSECEGVLDKATMDELVLWLQMDWVKPDVIYRHGEVDDEGVSRGKGVVGSDDHHSGRQIAEFQKALFAVKAYRGTISGYFDDETKAAVELFQEHGERGMFVIGGVVSDIGDKLIGHRRGVLDAPTQQMLKKVVDMAGEVEKKGGEVPRNSKAITLEQAKIIILKCTADFEGSWDAAKNDFNFGLITPNFDKAGLSMGLIQWNIKAGNFFEMLKKMYDKNPLKFIECYEGNDKERFRKYFESDEKLKNVWKTEDFCNFISKKHKENANEFFLWAKLLHKPEAIENCLDPPGWVTKKKFFEASHSLQPELNDFFKRLGEVKDFQDLQLEQAWKKYCGRALSELKWLKDCCKDNSNSELMEHVYLRTFAAIFDLCVHQGSFEGAKKVIKDNLATNKYSSQKEIMEMAVLERAKRALPEWQNCCASRRLGILNAEPTKYDKFNGSLGKDKIIKNCNYGLLKENPIVEGL